MKFKKTKIKFVVAIAILATISSTATSSADEVKNNNFPTLVEKAGYLDKYFANRPIEGRYHYDEPGIPNNFDLYTEDYVDSFVGSGFEVYSHDKKLTKDSVLEYKRPDGSIAKFNAQKNSDSEYYFYVKTDMR